MIGYLIAAAAGWLILKNNPGTSVQIGGGNDSPVAANANQVGTVPQSTVSTAANSQASKIDSNQKSPFATLDPYSFDGPQTLAPGQVQANTHPASGFVYPWMPIPRTGILTGRSLPPHAQSPGLQKGNDPTADPWLPPTKIVVETQSATPNVGFNGGVPGLAPTYGRGQGPTGYPRIIGPGVIGGPSTLPPSGVIAPGALHPGIGSGGGITGGPRIVGPGVIGGPATPTPIGSGPTATGIPPAKLATLSGGIGSGFSSFDSSVFSHGSLVG
jgi:hypothetical protein